MSIYDVGRLAIVSLLLLAAIVGRTVAAKKMKAGAEEPTATALAQTMAIVCIIILTVVVAGAINSYLLIGWLIWVRLSVTWVVLACVYAAAWRIGRRIGVISPASRSDQ
jgi:hypothetical protein